MNFHGYDPSPYSVRGGLRMAKDQWWGNMRLRTSFFIRQLWLERFCAVLKTACHYVFLQLVVFTVVVSHLFSWNIDQLQELWELVTSQIVTHYTMTFILFSWEHVFLEFLTWLITCFGHNAPMESNCPCNKKKSKILCQCLPLESNCLCNKKQGSISVVTSC